jgi:hypothetical protein
MTGTIDRVPPHTAADANQQIRDRTGERVQFFAAHPDRVPQRLSELDHAWDMARAIEANASALASAGEQERHAIKAISGDFESLSKSYSKPAAALRALAA